MRRSIFAARTAGHIQTEVLENRRLFAGIPMLLGGPGEPGRPGFGHRPDAPLPHGRGPDAIVISLPLGGTMHSTSDGVSTTAFSSNYAVNSTPPAAVASSRAAGSAQSTSTLAPRSPETVAVNTPGEIPAVVQSPSSTPVAQQVLPDAMADAASGRATATASADAIPNTASEPVFGPFTLGTIHSNAGQTDSAKASNSLLTLDPDAVDRSLRWQSQDATYRPKRPASPAVASEVDSLDLAARAAMHLQQATLSPVPTELADRPLWQRLATVAAAGLLVVTNTIVRRRQRRTALATHR